MELFFDLVFVAAVARLAEMLIERHDATGFLRFVGMFVPVAWAWMGYTYYANRFDTDDVPYRAMVSAGMAAVAAMAVAIGDFSDEGLMRFAIAYAAVRVVLLLMYVRARHHVPEMRDRDQLLPRRLQRRRAVLDRVRVRDGPARGSCSGSPASRSSSGRRSSAGR